MDPFSQNDYMFENPPQNNGQQTLQTVDYNLFEGNFIDIFQRDPSNYFQNNEDFDYRNLFSLEENNPQFPHTQYFINNNYNHSPSSNVHSQVANNMMNNLDSIMTPNTNFISFNTISGTEDNFNNNDVNSTTGNIGSISSISTNQRFIAFTENDLLKKSLDSNAMKQKILNNVADWARDELNKRIKSFGYKFKNNTKEFSPYVAKQVRLIEYGNRPFSDYICQNNFKVIDDNLKIITCIFKNPYNDNDLIQQLSLPLKDLLLNFGRNELNFKCYLQKSSTKYENSIMNKLLNPTRIEILKNLKLFEDKYNTVFNEILSLFNYKKDI